MRETFIAAWCHAALAIGLQTTVLLALGLVAETALLRRHAALQSMLQRAVVIGVLGIALLNCGDKVRLPSLWKMQPPATFSAPVMGAVTPVSPPSHSGAHPQLVEGPAPGASSAPTATTTPTTSSPPAAASTVVPSSTSKSVDLPLVLAGGWSLGVMLLTLWFAVGHARLARLCRRARVVTSGSAHELLQECAALLRVTPPRLLATPGASPCLAGVRRPVLLLPELGEDSDATLWRAIFIHELAHLARRDCAWKLLTNIMCVVLWPQPLLWWWRRRMELTSEIVCDRAVVESGCAARDYARCLLDWAEALAMPPLERVAGAGVVPNKSALARRVTFILQTTPAGSWRISRRMALRASLLMACLVGATPLLVAIRAAEEPGTATPEETIRTLVLALNNRDAALMANCVAKAKPADDLKGLAQLLERGDTKLSLLDVDVTTKDNTATVKVTVETQFRSFLSSQRKDTKSLTTIKSAPEELTLQREDGRWKIVVPDNIRYGNQSQLIQWVRWIAPPRLNEAKALAAEHGHASLAGRVTKADSSPAVGVTVQADMEYATRPKVFQDNWAIMGWPENVKRVVLQSTKTGDDGRYRMDGLLTGKYKITAVDIKSAPRHTPPETVAREVPVVDTTEHTLANVPDITLIAGALVEVRVLDDASGVPIKDIIVSGKQNSFATSDDNGVARLRLPPGANYLGLGGTTKSKTFVTTTDPAYDLQNNVKCFLDGKPQRSSNASTSLTVGNGDHHQIVFRLTKFVAPAPTPAPVLRPMPPGTAVLEGRAAYEDGRPAAGVTVMAHIDSGARWELYKGLGLAYGNFQSRKSKPTWEKLKPMLEAAAITRADGSFSFTGLTTAPYNVLLASEGNRGGLEAPGEWTAAALHNVWAREGATRRPARELRLTRGALISGQIVDDRSGAPLGGVVVGVTGATSPRGNDRAYFYRTDDSGRFSVRAPAGETSLYIAGPSMNDLAGNTLYADTKSEASVYVVKTTLGPYAGSHQVEYILDGGDSARGLGFGKQITIKSDGNAPHTLILRLRKLVPKPA